MSAPRKRQKVEPRHTSRNLTAFHRVFRPLVRNLDPDLGDILS